MQNKQKLLLIIAIITIIGFSITACSDNSSSKPVCTNPAGTIFLVGETHPDTAACGCEKNVPGQRVEGIAITNRESVANFPAMVTEFETALGYFTSTQITYVKNNLKEAKIITGTGAAPSISSGIFTIGNDRDENHIWDTLDNWFTTNSVAMIFDQSKNILYVNAAKAKGTRTV